SCFDSSPQMAFTSRRCLNEKEWCDVGVPEHRETSHCPTPDFPRVGMARSAADRSRFFLRRLAMSWTHQQQDTAKRNKFAPRVEALEDRTVPTATVTQN